MLLTVRTLTCDQPGCEEKIEGEYAAFEIRSKAKDAGWNLNSQGVHYCALHWTAKYRRLTVIDGGLFQKPKKEES
jgi:hypothetical protein